MVALPALGALAAAMMALLFASFETNRFVPNACANVASFLPANLVGQDLAVGLLVEAVCEHLRATPGPAGQQRRKPLILSVHGPPGVGKTFTHTLLARALYNRDPLAETNCPGQGCVGAKVLYGLNYIEAARESQLEAVRHAVLSHLHDNPNPMLVIEEYDKLDCASRGLLRQLIQHPELSNASMSRAIVLMESNLGFLDLEAMLTEAGGNKSALDPLAAEARLREVVVTAWRRKPACESLEDTLAFTSHIDFFLPYFPLTRQDIATLTQLELAARYGKRLSELGASLVSEEEAVNWLVDHIAGGHSAYPVEGGMKVHTECLRHVARLIRRAEEHIAQEVQQRKRSRVGNKDGKDGSAHGVALSRVYHLRVEPGGQALRLETEDGSWNSRGGLVLSRV